MNINCCNACYASFLRQTVSVRAGNIPLSICLQHLIICFICDVYRAYLSPLCWGNFTNDIFSISLANDFLLTIAI